MYNLVVGVAVAQFLFETAWINVGVVGLMTRILLAILPRRSSGIICFVVIMAYMVTSMFERLSCAWLSYKMDYTGAQMMATIKLTTFAWNYSDGKSGRSKKERADELAKTIDDEKCGRYQDKAGKHKLKFQIVKLKSAWDEFPGLLTYFGWIYQFSGYPVGPAIELREYIRGCETDSPSGSGPALFKFLAGFVFLGSFQFLSSLFPIGSPAEWTCSFSDSCTPVDSSISSYGYLNLTGGSLLSSEFASTSFPRQIVYLFAAGIIVRMRYYFAWLTAEAAFNMAGFGYQAGCEKRSAFFGFFNEWNGMANVDILRIETSTDMGVMKDWNFKTQRWLVHAVYKRVNGSMQVRMLATYVISALWHGLYPGYYITFIGAAFSSICLSGFYKKVPGRGKLFESTEGQGVMDMIGKIVKWFVTFAVLDFIVLGLLYLQMEHVFNAQKAVGFYMYPMVIVLAVVFMFIPSGKKKRKTA